MILCHRVKPKSVIRTSLCINHLIYIAFSSIFALLFAVLLPVWSCHSSLCLRQNACNTHEHKGKTDWKANDRFGLNENETYVETMPYFTMTLLLSPLRLPSVTETTLSPWLSDAELICNVFCPLGTMAR